MIALPDGNVSNDFGYCQWEHINPGDGILVPRSANSQACTLNKRFPDTKWKSTVKNQPDGKRLVFRIR